MNWGGGRVCQATGFDFESDDDWIKRDESQTIMRPRGEECCLFLQLFGRLSAIGILWSAGTETSGP